MRFELGPENGHVLSSIILFQISVENPCGTSQVGGHHIGGHNVVPRSRLFGLVKVLDGLLDVVPWYSPEDYYLIPSRRSGCL